MENSELKKQKRLGPAPIASFEKSFEDNTSPQGNVSSLIGICSTTTITTTAATAATTTEILIPNKEKNNDSQSHMEFEIEKNQELISNAEIKQHQQQQPTISVSTSTPSRKLKDIGRKLPPLQVTVGDGDDGGGGAIGSAGIVGRNNSSNRPLVTATLGLATPSTPRIDISRASSSSHHDSRDSSPENVFEQVGTGTLQETIGLGFREEGALDLRSSTEELYFMDPEQKKEEQEKMQQARKSPVIFKFDEHQTYLQQHQRKDSASSEVAALLCISGRTSRISSVGSQGSAVSRLSAISGISRSPSPHRMLLETSFCGPKPLENIVDGSIISTVEPQTAEALEQILLSRKHDPTQAVLAEGIHIETSPKKQSTKVANSATKTITTDKGNKSSSSSSSTTTTAVTYKTSSISSAKKGSITVSRSDSGKRVVGVTPSGTEYIRIKLKPDHMYEDHGLGPNERLVDMPTTSHGVVQKKPATLSLGRDISATEQRLTPSSSPKPTRHGIFARDIGGSRSPSPATVTVSRKSSFCSLFKTKDSPDSPRDRSRSRSKSRDRSTPQSQTVTPSKQKSVLAIFKPRRSGSKSKCSSPVDQETISQLDGISQVEFKFKSDTASEQPSRPSSRLRYYDTPLDGKSIHIPLHTPPEEKEHKFFINKDSKEPVIPPPPSIEPTSTVEKILKTETTEQAPTLPPKSPKPPQIEKIQRIENLDAIHSLPEDISEKERTWSLEVQRHSSQESQEIASDASVLISGRRVSKPGLTDVVESPVKENGIPPTVFHSNVPSVTSQIPPGPAVQQLQQHAIAPASKEKRRLLFATKLGSGSEEQIFSTQFSISKTESLSSQLSEQTIPESPAVEGKESLHRTDTVIRRTEETLSTNIITLKKKEFSDEVKLKSSQEIDETKPIVGRAIQKRESSEESQQKSSKSVSEEEENKPIVVMMRKKDSLEDTKRKSKSASEEDDSTHRHSRYIENFDIKKRFQDNTIVKKQQSRNSSDSSIKERDSRISSKEEERDTYAPSAETKSKHFEPSITLPQPPIERQSMISTDDPVESSESERDSEMDPNRIKRHITRHIGAIEDHESTGLVSQDSYEDELPYIPTTLPEERTHGVSLIPMKERVNMELKTCSVDRPRSTTPMNPACLEEYCGIATPDDPEHVPIRGEKLRISLPRKDSTKDRAQKSKSPRRISNVSGKSWFEFAEQGIRGQQGQQQITSASSQQQQQHQQQHHQNGGERRTSLPDEEPPPPLPPRKPSAGPATSTGQWINFENIPEKRKPPKRITALPKDSPQESSSKLHSMAPPIQYNYVKPEECQCECHEIERESAAHKSIASVDLLQQGEDMQPLLEPEAQEGIDPSDSSLDYSCDAEGPELHDFDKKLTLRQSKSNKTQIQEEQLPEQSSSLLRENSSLRSKPRIPDYRNQ